MFQKQVFPKHCDMLYSDNENVQININDKKDPSKYSGNFYLAVGSIGVISMCYHLPLCFHFHR